MGGRPLYALMILADSGILSNALINIGFPSGNEQILLWCQTICLWMFSNYVFRSNQIDESIGKGKTLRDYKPLLIRGLIYSIILFFLPGLSLKQWGSRFFLVLIFVTFLFILPLIRNWLVRSNQKDLNRRTAEWEVLANVLLIVVLGHVIAINSLGTDLENLLVIFSVSAKTLSISFLILAACFFLCDGGTHITRGILSKTGTAPQKLASAESVPSSHSGIDNKEFNRGKYIGNLERLMILFVVLVGSYETIGFIIAGKGLIRAKEFEDRDFAEYFLIGTFTSVGIAIAVGLIIKLAIQWLS